MLHSIAVYLGLRSSRSCKHMGISSTRPDMAVRACSRSLTPRTHDFHKTPNATVFLVCFPWGAKTEKSIQERGAQTGKETVMG